MVSSPPNNTSKFLENAKLARKFADLPKFLSSVRENESERKE